MSAGFGFDQAVTVVHVVSTLEGGAIFIGQTPDDDEVRVRFVGRGFLPLPGDRFHVKGQWSTYTDRFKRIHVSPRRTHLVFQSEVFGSQQCGSNSPIRLLG